MRVVDAPTECQPPTVESALAAATATLAAAGIETAHVDAEWLLADVLGVPRGRLRMEPGRALATSEAAHYADVLERRGRREPLQHIVGTQAFRDLTVRVGAGVMVPRPETEILVEWALASLPRPAPLVIDVGTGTGCIACAIAAARVDARVVALDVSPAAVELARANVAALGLSARVSVVESDLFVRLGCGPADLIVVNPPYLPSAVIPTLQPEVSRFDPPLALDGGADGLDVVRRLVASAPARLASPGALFLETAGGEQARAVVALLQAAGFVSLETRRDLAGVERFVAGRGL